MFDHLNRLLFCYDGIVHFLETFFACVIRVYKGPRAIASTGNGDEYESGDEDCVVGVRSAGAC